MARRSPLGPGSPIPTFDFDAGFKRFTDGFKIATNAKASIRGSRSGELVARCIVETGTSSYYAALKDATAEPVLKEICRNIAADELRHYKLFYDHLRRYLETEKIGRWKRVAVVLSRVRESEDDELAYAYYAANESEAIPYDRRRASKAYARRTFAIYRRTPCGARRGHGAEGGGPGAAWPVEWLADGPRLLVPQLAQPPARGRRHLT